MRFQKLLKYRYNEQVCPKLSAQFKAHVLVAGRQSLAEVPFISVD
jgi:hypothetical protein